MAVASTAEMPAVQLAKTRLQAILNFARQIKPETTVQPALSSSKLLPELSRIHDGIDDRYDITYRFGIVEAAARQIFYQRVTSTPIEDPAFVEIWNLLDILLVSGDHGICTPELICWLIEELLDSQTTTGCRVVFDYLESRRERLAAKDFHKKNLVFLRSCNELLRRLSRAEDAIFCGRVFFFLFQTFPLGDKSSVNLRGEFHTENVTKFEDVANEVQPEGMEVDTPENDSRPEPPRHAIKETRGAAAKAIKKAPEEPVLTNSALYPIFWRLQQDFCEPARLFQAQNFDVFKKGLAQTIRKFKATPTVPSSDARQNAESKRGTKREAEDEPMLEDETQDQFVDNYNPKYLTSRKLFDLEVSDLSFQRHIMVQALILIDFLLSLTEKAKKVMLAVDSANKSMLYAFTLSEDDSVWATATRTTITSYLQSFGDGRFYCRMVETVLSRDKNWVRWKIESCPSIVRDPISTEELSQVRKTIGNMTRPRRLPAKPVGSLNLAFLDEGEGRGLDALKNPARFTPPTVAKLIDGIKTDELDLDFAVGNEEAELKTKMDNKRWRLVRQLRATNLPLLDKMEPSKSVEEVAKAAIDVKAEDKEDVGADHDDQDMSAGNIEEDNIGADNIEKEPSAVGDARDPGEEEAAEADDDVEMETDVQVNNSANVGDQTDSTGNVEEHVESEDELAGPA